MDNKYKGTKTEKNLETAFAGESQARNKYTYFASVAKKEGYEQIAEIFQKTADNAAQQTENIKNMKNSIDEISRSISDNSAVAQESSATSEQLAAQASVLNQLLEKFEF